MAIDIQTDGQTVTAYLSGEIDHHQAVAMRQAIDPHLLGGEVKLLVLDFADVTFMDSSGIGLVMGRYRLLQYNGGRLHITNPAPHIYKVMRIAGLERLAVIDKTTPARRDTP